MYCIHVRCSETVSNSFEDFISLPMLVKKGQKVKMCYLHNTNDIHVSSAYTCTSKLLYIHQDCFTYIKIRHIYIKAHIYMLNDAALTSRLSDIFTSRFFSNMYIKFPEKYTS